jgi:hypothetical protein
MRKDHNLRHLTLQPTRRGRREGISHTKTPRMRWRFYRKVGKDGKVERIRKPRNKFGAQAPES